MGVSKTIISRNLLLWLLIFVAFCFFLYETREVLLPFVIGILVAYFLDPAADRLEKIGLSRTFATVIITLLFFISLAGALALLLPVIFGQITNLVAKIPGYYTAAISSATPLINDVYGKFGGSVEIIDQNQIIEKTSAYFMTSASDFFQRIWQSGMALINILSLIFISPVVTFYLLRDWDKITARINEYLPLKHAKTIRTQVKEIDATISGFLRGQLNVCLIMGLIYAAGLAIVGLEFGLLIGIITGILAFIPYAGFFAGFCTAFTVAIFQFGYDVKYLAAVVAVMLFGQLVEGNFLTPKLVGDRVGLHPLWLIFGMLAGAALLGFVGVFIAVPVTAILGVLIKFSLSEYKKSSLFKG